MKCENCPALRTEGYEYPESYCCIYPEDEIVDFADGSCGCHHKLAVIKKKIDELEDAMSKQYEGIGEWYMQEQEKEKTLVEALYQAFEKQDVITAQKGINGKLYPYTMDKRADGIMHSIVAELIYNLDKFGYAIIKNKEDKYVR